MGVLVGLGMAEVGLRAGHSRLPAELRSHLPDSLTDIAFRPHPYLSWEIRPNATMRSNPDVNSTGFRGRELEIPKPRGTLRVACLGGSTTFTTNVNNQTTYPVQLEAVLRQRAPELRVEVLNAGIPGYTTAESFMNLAMKVLDYEPDLVVVYHAINDVRPRAYAGYRADYGHFRRVWVEEDMAGSWALRQADHSVLFRVLRLCLTDYQTQTSLYYWVTNEYDHPATDPIELGEANLDGFKANLGAIADVCQARGIGVLFVSQCRNLAVTRGAQGEPFRRHNKATEEVAAERGLPFCDAALDFPQETTFRPTDPVHMTGPGARELARRVAAAIVDNGLLKTDVRHDARPSSDDAKGALPVPARPAALSNRSAVANLAEGRAFRPVPYFAYDLKPSFPEVDGLGPHNELALRGPPCAEESAEETARVLCIGGASTYGLGVEESDSYPRILERCLRADLGEAVGVLNGGVPGHTSAESIGAFHFKLRYLRPDVVVVSHDAEDYAAALADGYRTDYAHWRKTWREIGSSPRGGTAISVALQQGTDVLGAGHPRASLRDPDIDFDSGGLVCSPRPYTVYRNLLTLVDLACATGAAVVLVEADVGSDPVSESAALFWNRSVERVALVRGVAVVPRAHGPNPALFCESPSWLLNRQGLAERAERVEVVVAEVLMKRRR